MVMCEGHCSGCGEPCYLEERSMSPLGTPLVWDPSKWNKPSVFKWVVHSHPRPWIVDWGVSYTSYVTWREAIQASLGEDND